MARISRALIADSSLATLNEMGAKLRAVGCLTLIETSASRVRDRARTERPDVVVLGMGFSESEQTRAAEELKGDPVARRIPLVLAGPLVQHMEIGRTLMARLDGILPLPILAEELRAKLGASHRLKTMRAELLRRQVTYGRYGIDEFIPVDAPRAERRRVLLVTPPRGPLASQTNDLMRLLPASDPLDAVAPADAIEALLKARHDAAIVLGEGSTEDPGLELCADIRRHASLFHLPIVYLEPRPDGASRARAYVSGASEVLGPPFDAGAVTRVLDLAGRRAALRGRLQAAYRRAPTPRPTIP